MKYQKKGPNTPSAGNNFKYQPKTGSTNASQPESDKPTQTKYQQVQKDDSAPKKEKNTPQASATTDAPKSKEDEKDLYGTPSKSFIKKIFNII